MASQQRVNVAISAASSGNNTLVAATAGHRIRVLSYTLVATSAVNAKFQSAASGTDITGLMTMATGVPISPAFQREGHFETVTGELLNLNLSGAVQVSGHLTYCLVQA